MLTGRRLFQGDSDYATVRMVQEARVPPLSGFRSDVSPELEGILGRLLARDPGQRFSSAEDVVRALTQFRAKSQHAVGQLDIAALVGESAPRNPSKASIIDKLIEDALQQFESLKE